METGTALNLNVILPLLSLWLSDIVSVSLRTLTGTEPAISTNKRPKLNQSTFETTLQLTSDQAQELTNPTLTLGSRLHSAPELAVESQRRFSPECVVDHWYDHSLDCLSFVNPALLKKSLFQYFACPNNTPYQSNWDSVARHVATPDPATAAKDQRISDTCNDHRFGRSRESIWNEAIRPEKDGQFRSDRRSITASKKHVFFWIPPC